MARLLVSLLVAALCTGCASMSYKSPQVSVVDLQLVDVNFYESKIVGDLKYSNPNSTPLVVKGFQHALTLNEHKLEDAESTESFEIAPNGEVTKPASFKLDGVRIINHIKALARVPEVQYSLESKVYVEGGGILSSGLSNKNSGTLKFNRGFFVAE